MTNKITITQAEFDKKVKSLVDIDMENGDKVFLFLDRKKLTKWAIANLKQKYDIK
jgi:hypothetical protein